MKLLAATAFLSLAIASVPAVSAKSPVREPAKSCTVSTQATTYNADELKRSGLAVILNGYFGQGGRVGPTGIVASDNVIVPSSTRSLKLSVTSKVCRDKSAGSSLQRADSQVNNTCIQLGCVDDLGPTFSGLPNGSVVKINTCGGGYETERTYMKNASGQWQLVAYRQEYKDQNTCTVE